MSREIYPASPAAKVTEKKYPWKSLQLGYSFKVATDECSFKSLQNYASRMGKKLGRRYRVVNHGLEIGYEVAYIEDR